MMTSEFTAEGLTGERPDDPNWDLMVAANRAALEGDLVMSNAYVREYYAVSAGLRERLDVIRARNDALEAELLGGDE